MRCVAGALAVLVVLALGAAGLWQHQRFVHVRRVLAQDRQALLHPADAFHVLLFLELPPGADLLERVAALRDALEADGETQVVYAGQVALDALASRQLAEERGGEVHWDAVILAQLPSREAWARRIRHPDVRRVLDGFAGTYAHGMRRWRGASLGLPQLLLARRVVQIATGAPSHYPFQPAPEAAAAAAGALARLAEARDLGERAIVVVNLTKRGTPAQVAADRRYTGRMVGLMAEGGHGPLHLGEAVRLEGTAHFDGVALVYYPGVDYFLAMVRSRFYQGIVGDKQLADTQATLTVPILEQL
jgi:hypothetical protein